MFILCISYSITSYCTSLLYCTCTSSISLVFWLLPSKKRWRHLLMVTKVQKISKSNNKKFKTRPVFCCVFFWLLLWIRYRPKLRTPLTLVWTLLSNLVNFPMTLLTLDLLESSAEINKIVFNYKSFHNYILQFRGETKSSNSLDNKPLVLKGSLIYEGTHFWGWNQIENTFQE